MAVTARADLRTEPVAVWLTPDEKQRLDRAAAAQGMKLATFLRHASLLFAPFANRYTQESSDV